MKKYRADITYTKEFWLEAEDEYDAYEAAGDLEIDVISDDWQIDVMEVKEFPDYGMVWLGGDDGCWRDSFIEENTLFEEGEDEY